MAARLQLPFAANCVALSAGDPLELTRQRWGGSLLERARLHGSPALVTAAPHALAAAAEEAPGRVEAFRPTLEPADLAARVVGSRPAPAGGVSLDRGEGRRQRRPRGRLGGGLRGTRGARRAARGAVGCSRVVTSAGWRPHADQVGQTGTKVSPELYIACGISGATQHIAGCKGAKHILAINADAEAPIMASADYAVIGDLHEVVPAISAELRRVRGA